MKSVALALVGLALALFVAAITIGVQRGFGRAYSRWARRTSQRLVRRHRVRINRYKLARKWLVREALLEDPEILAAAEKHALDGALSREQAMDRVGEYLDEIIPAFNIISYYKLGHFLAHVSLNFLYRVKLERGTPETREAQVVYVMNHRSNVDYVLVAYALAREVAVSYAVGEWARVWPLEHLFKSFGSYFIRRGYREPLYHKVLERYVQRVVVEGVAQGIFIEGGLSRDGALREPKIGLLEYIAGTLREPGFTGDISFVPVGINYDRVLEDRVLLREGGAGLPEVSRLRQLRETAGFLFKGALKYSRGRLRRYGYACVNFGRPVSLRSFLAERGGTRVLFLDPEARKLHVKALAEVLMAELARAIPVTPVPFTAALLLESGDEASPRSDLALRAAILHRKIRTRGGYVLEDGDNLQHVVDSGLRILSMRRLVVESDDVVRVAPRERPMIEYYAKSIAVLKV